MKGTPLTEETYEYIVKHFASGERTLLERMSVRAKAAEIPMIHISDDQAKFIAFFLKAVKAKKALDVGTLFGYSAAIMARAMGTDSEVTTLENKDKHAAVAKENFDTLRLRNVVIKIGPALESMKLMRRGTFDFVLIDADKPNYSAYLTEAIRLVKPGGVIAGDNALAWGKIAGTVPKGDSDAASVTAIRGFNEAFANHKHLFGTLIPVGDGMTMGVTI
ncbi:MAG TPA: O-methyltransferase [Candidatus Kapabacteria bacterium]|jgi:predicted O-methyltransferase YrrM